ncbi:glycosyltransferase family 2 protein [Salinibacter ruber]|uniref:glycosyltransferase family 2 protein n=1 Tax=Salinibacter ruber TaxID=146919 RepID=UPI002074874A|nr:glycosyltransferase family A protein [Salinibacter ruber]
MTRADPAVSVVLPTYNRANLVGRAILSVQRQTFDKWELVVVDDSSEDRTKQVVESFDDERIRYTKHTINRGGGAARNTGIRMSEGEYIAFLDSDDKWYKNKIKKQLQVFRQNCDSVSLVYTGMEMVGHNERKILPESKGWISEELILENPVGSCSAVMVKSEVFKNVGLFDEDLPSSQDKDMWFRICKKYKADFVDGVHVMYDNSLEKKKISRNDVANCAGRLKFFNKHKDNMGSDKKAKYLAEMGRLFRTHIDNKQYAAKIMYKKSLSCGELRAKIVLFTLLSYLKRDTDLKISSIIRSSLRCLGYAYENNAYKK